MSAQILTAGKQNPATYKKWYEKNVDKKRAYSRAYYAANKEKRKQVAREYKAKNPGFWRKSHIKRLYGITVERVEEMRIAQGNKCAICADEFSNEKKGKKLHIDHCHSSGVVRGLLCQKCNLHLGWIDKPGILASALKYLGC